MSLLSHVRNGENQRRRRGVKPLVTIEMKYPDVFDKFFFRLKKQLNIGIK